TLDKIHQRHKLVVGVVLSGGPFGSIDPATQRAVGFNVDLAQALGRGLGVEVETVQVQPSNRIQFLQQGRVDLLVAAMELNPERAELLAHVPTP
ncbi:transporter substrate-binding domain-containing protein, partial [Ralstonia pseudosolanacearum]